MMIASMPGQPITRLVLNDIGPFIPKAALARIRDYLSVTASGVLAEFADVAALERHLRLVHEPFGPLTDAQWAHLARYSAQTLPDGRVAMHYDPKYHGPVLRGRAGDVDLWALWPATSRLPVLAIRGASSDVLSAEVLARMQETGAQAFVVPEAGHAPALMDPAQIAAVRRFSGGRVIRRWTMLPMLPATRSYCVRRVKLQIAYRNDRYVFCGLIPRGNR